MTKQKVLLTILDGWGEDKPTAYNAVEQGNTKTWHRLLKDNLNSTLITFGLEVGLPEGQMGNSEVGHTNIGAGRVVFQELPRINKSIKEGDFAKQPKILSAISHLKAHKSTLHLMGLYSNGGVHSHLDHLLFSAELFAKQGVEVKLHLFSDGRDTPPSSAIGYADSLNQLLKMYPNVSLATLSGRYYAMDRDNRWERVELAYNAMVLAQGQNGNSYEEVLNKSYAEKINDEFILPTILPGYKGMQDGDMLFMINFRTDRAREILDALIIPDFKGFARKKVVKFAPSLGMVSYSDSLAQFLNIIFEPANLKNGLGEYLSAKNLTQLRVAETEKYPHVTFFFSGGQEANFNGEDRILVPSPKDVPTYDLKPEMSAYVITEKLVEAINTKKYDFIVVNYANGDMVGHTGVMEAAKKATETVDNCLLELEKAVIANDYIWLIIADHGNCETMWDEVNNVAHTQHTTNLVRCVLVNHKGTVKALNNGKLADVAPSILDLMNLDKPVEMDGTSLLKK
jgi:2,3-bisphosphoglycerate-independent phosphoglycerate mutase